MAVAYKDLLDPANLTRIENYALMAKAAVEGFLSGMHRSVYHGFGTEFLQYRNYVPGEDLKSLDWKVYAKRNELVTKVFQEETSMNCYFVVDASASHEYRGERAAVTKLRYACMVAACLAYLATRQGDNIALFAYQDSIVEALEPGHRNSQLLRFLQVLTRLKPEGQANHEKLLESITHRMRSRGLVVYLSDMLEAENILPRQLENLRFQHCDCLALQILDPDEKDLPHGYPVRYIDSESGREVTTFADTVRESYEKSMNQFLNDLKTGFSHAQVEYTPLLTTHHLGHALGQYLHKREAIN
ncbi:MAG: hypothetical protein CMI18_03485 [Opitutaceae bacterium]|nr:hypothetical protein [Opitutaceae bacterium]|tara:strand:+ start:2107 stop:3009 length:903 start_codon:yes stop_codon:yes gene_type:complete